jgi:electron transfer flavoprotein alpha subunit/transcriptional regulator with XRE-family HTH domain
MDGERVARLMPAAPTNDIWVWMDCRSNRLFGLSLNVLAKARALAAVTGGKTVACLLVPQDGVQLTASDGDACALEAPVETACLAHGADQVLRLENDRFATPRADLFAHALCQAVRTDRPRLVLATMTDFGRELAARTARLCRAGLIADCRDLVTNGEGGIVGECPAWGGTIVSQITFAEGWGTGFATVQPHCCQAQPVDAPANDVQRRMVDQLPEFSALRMLNSRPAPESQRKLETAPVVVVGGAGLGSAQAFRNVRELAAVLGGEVGATRPPVLHHWVDENRLIGQTGKHVAPKLLLSIGTSGATQYTAGIMQADTIVAVNRDPGAPIFQIADAAIVADVHTFLPVLIERTRQTVMRQLADVLCEAEVTGQDGESFGRRIRKLREGHAWSVESLAEATGQTPDFIQQVEDDILSPPVGFLLRLAGALDVDPGTFLGKEEQVAIRDRRLEAYVRRTRDYAYQTLTEGGEADHLRAFMVTIEPHGAHKPVAYKHEGEEFIFVMAGELELTLDQKAHVLKTGEHMHFNSYIPHRLKSLSGEPTRCLVVLYTV